MAKKKKESQLKLFTRENKNFSSFFTKLYIPTTPHKKGNTYTINLGRKNDTFNEIEALKKLAYLQEEINKGNYNYKDILLAYNVRDINVKTEDDLTLEEVAELYFNRYFEDIKVNFYTTYKYRFNFENIEDVEENQLFKNKMKSSKTYYNYYKNYILVEEYVYKQEYSKRTKKPKKEKTKVGIKKKTELSQRLIKNISKPMLEVWVQGIKRKTTISDKTKYNLITQFKTIFNFAYKNDYIDVNPFSKIETRRLQKNPKNVRERILKVEESNLLLNKLYEKKGLNSFHGTLLGLCSGARVETILNIRKSDFNLNYEIEEFKPYYYTVKLYNFKTRKNYEVPLPRKVGHYFYLLLKDYEDDEYVLRAVDPTKRTNKSLAELPKDFRDICAEYINATDEMKIYYEYIREDKEALEVFRENHNVIDDFTIEIEAYKKRINDNKDKLAELRKEYLSLKNHDNYLKNNFSFHNLRHTLSSHLSLVSPFVATKFLNHSADKLPMAQQTLEYSKADIKIMKETLDIALKDFLIILDEKIENLKHEINYTTNEEEIRLFYAKRNIDKHEAKIKANMAVKSNSFEVSENAELKKEILLDDSLSQSEKALKINELYWNSTFR